MRPEAYSGLNELADPLPGGALMSAGGDHLLFAGAMGHLSPHALAAPVLVTGVDRPFRLRIAYGAWHTCLAAVIPTGVVHEMDFGGGLMAALAVEGHVCSAAALGHRLRDRECVGPVLIAKRLDGLVNRDLTDADAAVGDAFAVMLDWAVGGSRRCSLEPRIAAVLARFGNDPADQTPAISLARELGLSPSRFLHLFSSQVGVPLRRFRLWNRLRAATRAGLYGTRLTDAALDAGFSDQAHFSRTFRKMLGVSPLSVLSRVDRAAWVS
jgi:AraC-like DNA-binding protein